MTFHMMTNDTQQIATVYKHESCPLRVYLGRQAEYMCYHPAQPRGENYCPDGEIPKDCPLIKVPLDIRLSPKLQEDCDARDTVLGVDSSVSDNDPPIDGPRTV